MAWTEPRTWTANTIVGATDFNTYMRDQQLNLKQERPYGETGNTSAYSTTSTAYTPVSTADFSVIITAEGTRVAVWASHMLKCDNTTNNYVDAVVYCSGGGYSLPSQLRRVYQNQTEFIAHAKIFTGLHSGSGYIFYPAFRISGGTGEGYINVAGEMIGANIIAVEV